MLVTRLISVCWYFSVPHILHSVFGLSVCQYCWFVRVFTAHGMLLTFGSFVFININK